MNQNDASLTRSSAQRKPEMNNVNTNTNTTASNNIAALRDTYMTQLATEHTTICAVLAAQGLTHLHNGYSDRPLALCDLETLRAFLRWPESAHRDHDCRQQLDALAEARANQDALGRAIDLAFATA